MAEPTVSELDARIAELQRQRDIKPLEGSKAIKAALVSGKVATLVEDLEALLTGMSGQSVAGQQARNVASVVRGARGLIDGEIARIEQLVAAGETPSAA